MLRADLCTQAGLPAITGMEGSSSAGGWLPGPPPSPHPPAAGLSSPAEPGHKHQTRCERPRGGPVTQSHPEPGWGRLAEGAPHQASPLVSLAQGRAPVGDVGLDPPPRGSTPGFLPVSPHSGRSLGLFASGVKAVKRISSKQTQRCPQEEFWDEKLFHLITGVIAVSSFFGCT